MELYVALSAEEQAPATPCIPVWAGCCTAERLQVRRDVPRGGYLMVLRRSPVSDTALFCRDILRVCLTGQHEGLILDFPPGQSDLVGVAQELSALCPSYGLSLGVPEAYAGYSRGLVIVSTALVGGSLREKLKTAAAQYGADRVMLDLERTCRDYLLPCPVWPGCCLSRATFAKLSSGCTRYDSPELCARYFTYRCGTQSHYVVYDDAETLRKKLALAEELGIHRALIMYREVQELWPIL